MSIKNPYYSRVNFSIKSNKLVIKKYELTIQKTFDFTLHINFSNSFRAQSIKNKSNS
ncbi:hypothetical protein GCM10022216_19060 [Sphingobacterium kyonggiense]|uniref:Uncharacterized protein n=1 Tax=Sphingobacterium kyonggiense TaxID=714075 RepID=A0ABP7YS87_9SPHI